MSANEEVLQVAITPSGDTPSERSARDVANVTTRSADPNSFALRDALAPHAPPVRDPERYEVICEHGRGGLGRVSRVHDKELGRDVAVKELLSRGPISELRFAREARITARLEHPGIVPLYEAGRWPDGTPFYAMKLVSGRPLRALIAERNTVDERIGLLHHVIAVADAMAYAHGRNIIHRDLKPANVIVGEFGETVVIDWGLAKDLSDAATIGGDGSVASSDHDLTKAGSVLGTPAYMPPEQERGESVDQRADVFAIGAMLWELCSLHKVPPVDRRQRHRLLRRAGIDDDLVAILDKTIDPEPAKRYADAGALATDLKAFKSGTRITARSYSLPALLRHWMRRHRALAVSSAALAVLVVVSVLALAVLYRSSTRNAEIARARLIQSYTDRGRRALLDGNYDDALIYLVAAVRGGDRSPTTRFMLERAAQPRLADRAVVSTTEERTWTASFSPDGTQLVVADGNGARVLDARTQQLRFTVRHDGGVRGASYNARGTRLATADEAGTVRVWSASTGELVRSFHHDEANGAASSYEVVAFSPDGRRVAATSSKSAQVWELDGSLLVDVPHQQASYWNLIAFSADGRWFAVASRDEVYVYDTRTWHTALTIAVPQVVALDFDPSGPRLAIATASGEASIWSIPVGERIHRLLATGEPLRVIRYSGDGAVVATGGKRGNTSLWVAGTGEPIAGLSPHKETVSSIDLDATLRLIMTASNDSTIAISDIDSGLPLAVLQGPRGAIMSAQLDAGSRSVLAVGWDGSAHLMDGTPSYLVWREPELGAECGTQTRTQDGRFIALNCHDLGSRIWDSTRHVLLAELPGLTAAGGLSSAPPVVTADGERAAVAIGNTVVVYRLPGGEVDHTIVHDAAVTAVAFAATGHALASGDERGAILRDRGDGTVVALPSSSAAIKALACLADGRVVSADVQGRMRIHEGDKGAFRELARVGHVRTFRLSRDGGRLLTLPTLGDPAAPMLWDLEAGRLIERLAVPTVLMFAGRFVQDDRLIVTASNDGVPRLWDGATGKLIKSYVGSNASAQDATMSPDGSMIVTGSTDGFVRFWDTATGALLWMHPITRAMVAGLHFEGEDLVTRSSRGSIARWHFPKLASLATLDPILRCLSLRFDAETGGTIEQSPCEKDAGLGARHVVGD